MTEQNRPLDTMDEIAYRELQAQNKRLHIINKKLKQEVDELRTDNKKLAHQIEDRINQLRRSGGL